MQSTRLISALAILALAPTVWAAPSGPMPSPSFSESSQDPQTIARNSYNQGHQAVQSAAKLELEAASMPAFAAQYGETAKNRLRAARENFRKAVEADPEMKEAWNMLGFTSRKLGDYQESLSAYEKALELSPNYPEAIEYRGELFLLTGRLEDLKQSYATLLTLDAAYAGMLKTAMEDFLKAGKEFPASVTAKDREDFASWVAAL